LPIFFDYGADVMVPHWACSKPSSAQAAIQGLVGAAKSGRSRVTQGAPDRSSPEGAGVAAPIGGPGAAIGRPLRQVIAKWSNLSSIGTGPSTRLAIRRITRASRDVFIVTVISPVRHLLALNFILIINN